MMESLNAFKMKFENCEQISKGGQKKVYKVSKHGKLYAFKILHDCNDVRVLQEIDILQKIDIKGVPKIFETGELLDDDGDVLLYILEEYICENSLRKRVKEKNLMSLKEAYNLVSELLEIEVKLEELGIIHRDIKPDNILVNENGEIYLIDFGVAKVIGNSSLTSINDPYAPHTPGYAPSEQVMNDRMQINSRTDLYQIGVTLYELIRGFNPFVQNSRDVQEVHYRTERLNPERIEIIGDTLGLFSEFIAMLMAKKQSQRPDTAKKALQYLNAIRMSLKWED